MPYPVHHAALNAPAIADNLMAFFKANQVQGLAAVGGSALKPLAEFSDTVANRTQTAYPAIAFRTDNDATDHTEDVLVGAYSVTFEMMVENPTPAEAVRQGRIYVRAIKHMIVNIPDSDLIANTGALANTSSLYSLESGTDPIRANEDQTDFLQILEVKAAFVIRASAYA
jgi:hypothetical protein